MIQSRAIVDKLLTTVSNGLFLQASDFIAEKVLPPVQVAQRSGKYGNYGTDHLRIVNTAHVGKGGYLEIDPITRGSDTYYVEEHALKSTITAEDFANVEQPYDEREDRTIGLTHLLALAKEKALADTLTDASVITQGATLSGNARYNNLSHADSDPLGDSLTAKGTIKDACGRKPNAIAMDEKVADALRVHAQLLDALGYKDSRPGGLTDEELARALDVDMVLVGKSVYESANKGQTSSISPVWGKGMVYFRTTDNMATPAKREKILGVEIRQNGTAPRQVFRYNPDEPIGSEVIITQDMYDQLLLNAECAYLLQTVID